MMNGLRTFLLISSLVFSFNLSNAQNRWSAEFRPGLNFITRDLVKTNLETGYGFEGTLGYRFMPHLGVYAGWVWNKFNTDQSFAGNDVDFEETGYTFGLQYTKPFTSKLGYLIRGGGIYNHIEVENNNGDIIADSGHGLGWQIESGISFSGNKRWSITPSVRYRSLSRDVRIEDVVTEVNLNYLSAGVGLTWLFSR